jgi:hypothetical protein
MTCFCAGGKCSSALPLTVSCEFRLYLHNNMFHV